MAVNINLRASNGQYLCAEGGGGREVLANRVERGPWETFTAVRADPPGAEMEAADLTGGQRIALRTDSGQYVCAENGGGEQLIANRTAIGPWETFTIAHADLSAGPITSGQGVVLRTANGQFFCAEGGGGREVTVDRNGIGPWETFTIEVQEQTFPLEPSQPEQPA